MIRSERERERDLPNEYQSSGQRETCYPIEKRLPKGKETLQTYRNLIQSKKGRWERGGEREVGGGRRGGGQLRERDSPSLEGE